jgi:hypothetical protein
VIWASGKAKYFLARRLDGNSKGYPTGKSVCRTYWTYEEKSLGASFLMSAAATHVVWIGAGRSIAHPTVPPKIRTLTALHDGRAPPRIGGANAQLIQ